MAKIELGTELEVHAVQPKSSHGKFDAYGRFIPDGRPMQPPIGYRAEPSLIERVREMVRSENLQREIAEQGLETFEESNDFYIEDEPDSHPMSMWENDEDTPIEMLLAKQREAAEAAAAASGGDDGPKPPTPPEPLKKARKARQDEAPEGDDGEEVRGQ